LPPSLQSICPEICSFTTIATNFAAATTAANERDYARVNTQGAGASGKESGQKFPKKIKRQNKEQDENVEESFAIGLSSLLTIPHIKFIRVVGNVGTGQEHIVLGQKRLIFFDLWFAQCWYEESSKKRAGGGGCLFPG